MKFLIDGVALVSSVISILSICLNVIQWRERGTLRETLKARLQGAASSFHHIAFWAADMSEILEGLELVPPAARKLLTRAGQIKGIAEGARGEIVMQAINLLDFVPQHVNLVDYNSGHVESTNKG